MSEDTSRRTVLALVVVAVVVALGAGCSDGPSCSQAVTYFYTAGCMFRDGSGVVIDQDTEIAQCQAQGSQLAGNSTCQSDFQAYLSCIDGIEPVASDPTACNSCYMQQATVAECQIGSSS